MNPFVLFAMFALVGVIISLVWGLISMGGGGEADENRSLVLMAARVKWQAVAIVLLLISLYFSTA